MPFRFHWTFLLTALLASTAQAQTVIPDPENLWTNSNTGRRVALINDALLQIGPPLAIELAKSGHDLVIAQPQEGLVGQLEALGSKVVVVEGVEQVGPNDESNPEHAKKFVDAAMQNFGGFDSACIRTGVHGTGNILAATPDDCDVQYQGNFRSVFLALQALLPPLVEQQSGQVVINTSASGYRPVEFAALYSAMRAGANALIRSAAQTVAPHGVTLNGTGTYAMNYPSFLHDVGADTDPEKFKEQEDMLPIRRLVEPEDAAHFVATLIDGKATGQTAQFFSIDGGWAFM